MNSILIILILIVTVKKKLPENRDFTAFPGSSTYCKKKYFSAIYCILKVVHIFEFAISTVHMMWKTCGQLCLYLRKMAEIRHFPLCRKGNSFLQNPVYISLSTFFSTSSTFSVFFTSSYFPPYLSRTMLFRIQYYLLAF